MMILLDFPSIVKQYSPYFEDLFSSEGYIHFQRLLSGLIVSENKTVEAINRLFILKQKHQSSANKFMNRQNFDLGDLNTRRLDFMQGNDSTQFKAKLATKGGGVLSIDSTLLSHYGNKFANIYNLWDYVNNKYSMSHDLVTLYYSDSKTDYPVDYQLWTPPNWEAVAQHFKKHEVHINEERWTNRHKTKHKKAWRDYMRKRYQGCWPKLRSVLEVYKNKNHIGLDLLRKFKKNYPDYDFPVALDSGFTNSINCATIDTELMMTYVGFVKDKTKVVLATGVQKTLKEFAAELKEEHKKTGKVFRKTSYYYRGKKLMVYAYCANHRLKNYNKKQRLVIAYQKPELNGNPTYTICNRLDWHVHGILTIRRSRWPIETYHQEGKSEGLDSYQVRNLEAIHTHIAFVVVAYSMLRRAQYDSSLLSSIRQMLHVEANGTLAFLRRLMKAEALAVFVKYICAISSPKREQELLKQLQPFFANIAYH